MNASLQAGTLYADRGVIKLLSDLSALRKFALRKFVDLADVSVRTPRNCIFLLYRIVLIGSKYPKKYLFDQ